MLLLHFNDYSGRLQKYLNGYTDFYDVSMVEIFLTLPFFLCTNEQLSDC